MLQLHPALPGERAHLDHPQADQPEPDDQHPAQALEPELVIVEGAAQRGGTRAEQDEDQRKAGREAERVQQGGPPPPAHFRQRHPGEKPDVGRHQREHAGGEKAEQSGRERDHDAEGGGLAHRPVPVAPMGRSRRRHSRHTPWTSTRWRAC